MVILLPYKKSNIRGTMPVTWTSENAKSKKGRKHLSSLSIRILKKPNIGGTFAPYLTKEPKRAEHPDHFRSLCSALCYCPMITCSDVPAVLLPGLTSADISQVYLSLPVLSPQALCSRNARFQAFPHSV